MNKLFWMFGYYIFKHKLYPEKFPCEETKPSEIPSAPPTP